MKLFKVIRTTARGVKFATRVGITVGSNMLQGVANVADVAGRAAKKTSRGDWDRLERLAERTAREMCIRDRGVSQRWNLREAALRLSVLGRYG